MSTTGSVKSALRSRLLAARAGLGEPVRRAASAQVCALLKTLPEVASARALLAYAPFGTELDVEPLLRERIAAGVGVFLPFVDGEGLGVARVRDLGADIEPGWRGVREPRAGRRRPARPDRLQAAIVPGIGFDRSGHRLGYGGGHFDRLLAALPPSAPLVGVAFACQVVDAVPAETHDVAVDLLVTEEGVLRTAEA